MYEYYPHETFTALCILFINTNILWLCMTSLEKLQLEHISDGGYLYWMGLVYAIIAIASQAAIVMFQIKHNMSINNPTF